MAEVDSTETLVTDRVCNILQEIIRQFTSENLRQDVLDYIFTRLERVENILSLSSQIFNVDDRIFVCISQAKYLVRSAYLQSDAATGQNCQPGKCFTGERGRPRYNITSEQLEYFIEHGFTAGEIAALLHVGEATVRRRLHEYGLSTSVVFTPLSDEELDKVVKDVKRDFVQSGYRMVVGVLHSRGLKIQERRVMESLRRVDTEGVLMRSLQLRLINRREYKVYGPNALWHIDTNHKLIR